MAHDLSHSYNQSESETYARRQRARYAADRRSSQVVLSFSPALVHVLFPSSAPVPSPALPVYNCIKQCRTGAQTGMRALILALHVTRMKVQ